MKEFYKDYLWAHNICVSEAVDHKFDDAETKEMTTVIELLASHYGIVFHEGAMLADRYIYGFVESKLSGRNVPEAFYRGFPQSVHNLSAEELLIDQLYHYYCTYGNGDFDESGHSIFEREVIRTALKEDVEPKYFDILTEKQAIEKLNGYFNGVLASTRPLNETQTKFVLSAMNDFGFGIKNVASKDTAMNLLLATRVLRFADFLSLTDVPKFVEKILASFYPAPHCYTNYSHPSKYQEKVNSRKPSLTNLHLTSADRKFVTKIIHVLFEKSNAKTLSDCLEKKKIWCGLLHHIHYKPRNLDEQYFVDSMRSNSSKSALSEIESYINSNKIIEAAKAMKKSKGSSYILRNLNYLLSRCTTSEQVEGVIDAIGTDANPVVLMQLGLSYANEYGNSTLPRSFSFSKMNKMKHHRETAKEASHRKSYVRDEYKRIVSATVFNLLAEHYEGKLGDKKVYLSNDMLNIALPVYNSTGETGMGILPTGSRIPFNGNVIRAFTYWEKVNDIDLSVIGISEDATRYEEFSWRTMAYNQSKEITFSGDETSGYHGGSEYFDVDINLFKAKHPDIRYLLFNNNVFSGTPFNKCYCTAGFMSRDDADAGEVYEPKTVKTSYKITCDSTFGRLFALDLKTSEMVWLNMTENTNCRVAASCDFSWIKKYLNITKSLNYYELFNSLANSVTLDSSEADIVVSDEVDIPVKEGAEVIHSCDIEAVMKYMNL